MFTKFIFWIFIASSLTLSCTAQAKPAWVVGIQKSVKKQEPAWIFKEYELKMDVADGWYRYEFRLSNGKEYASAELHWYDILSNRDETFEGLVTIKDNNRYSAAAARIKIDGLGDRAYAWNDKKSGNWSAIYYRKGKMFVMLDCSSEAFGRRAAELIAQAIPSDRALV
jgi:hypothetical protein